MKGRFAVINFAKKERVLGIGVLKTTCAGNGLRVEERKLVLKSVSTCWISPYTPIRSPIL